MEYNNESFHSNEEKRTLLIVEDEFINREILKTILENDYIILFAEDGEEALKSIQENNKLLSLVILDLIIPKKSGLEVLRWMRSQPEYQDIPVIVASGDQASEIECLNAGASDFIQKPYPDPGVILARVHRAIELFETRQLIQDTERDPLTGLYNREFFFSYAEQFDQHHPETEMDAIMLDIDHFSTINERYGREYGDNVLRLLSERVKEIVHEAGGIVCRKEADIFLVYCPHREDYKSIMDNSTMSMDDALGDNTHVRLRMGIYSNVDKSLELERRFDRAKMAADTVRNSYTRNIAIYDDALHQSELYLLQLIEDFPRAIEEKEFKVYFQPKYNIRSEKPVLSSAEGLVRWVHPELGMISPGVFIPLFEENGLIQKLDRYVWREAARQIREWQDTLGFTVPVSINVSRVDMADPDVVKTLLNIIYEFQLNPSDLHLEVTESAYAEDADQIIEIVKQMRSVGFTVEMDDFGSGYSSLNMLSTLPIDVLKMDMKFIQSSGSPEKNMEMIGIIIDIAQHLSVPVVAEGVETQQQLDALKELGCDIVQGYYFSPPVPAEKFEEFLIEARDSEHSSISKAFVNKKIGEKDIFSVFKKWSANVNISMRRASVVIMLVTIIAAAALFICDYTVTRSYLQAEEIGDRYVLAQQSSLMLQIGSDTLTDAVRCFVVTGDIHFLENYFEEAEVTRTRNQAVSNLYSLEVNKDSPALGYLTKALEFSNELMDQEYLAMRYILSTGDYDQTRIPAVLKAVELTPEQDSFSVEEKRAEAIELVFGKTYFDYKEQIELNANQCTQKLIDEANQERLQSSQRMNRLLLLQTILTVLLLVIVLLMLLFLNVWVRNPLVNMVEQMKAKHIVEPSGAEELRFVSETYNTIFEENRKTHENLTYGNMHDPLTNLYNRNAYNYMHHDMDMSHNALLMIDVDKFKSINDTYGHDVGDLVLMRVADVLKYSFRATDYVFRLGGDEFVVIMLNADSSMGDLVKNKINQANVMLQKPNDDIPPVSLSVGVAFPDRENPGGDIFKDADTALYRVKQSGRCGCNIY